MAENTNSIFGREPVLWLTAIQAVIACAVGFGLNWTGQQVTLFVVASGAILGLIARGQVTPKNPGTVDDLKTYIGNATPAVIDKAGVQIVSTSKTIALLLGMFLLLGSSSVQAADGETSSVLALSRVALGVDGGVVYYDLVLPDSVEVAPRIVPYVSYSLTDQLSITFRVGIDPKYGRLRTTLGARGAVVGFRDADRVGAALALDRVWYSGDGDGAYAAKDSYVAGINLWWVAVQKDGRDLVYIKPQVSYDNLNGWDEAAYLGLNLVGGK